jgi:hypothetical protein
VDANGDGDTSDPGDYRPVGQYHDSGLASQPLLASIGAESDVAIINRLGSIDPIEPAPVAPDPEEPWVPEEIDPGDVGLLGGHFDLDVSHEIYPFDGGSTDKHAHEWDDKTGLHEVDFLNIPKCQGNVEACLADPNLYVNDTAFNDLDEQVTNAAQRFHIVVANTEYSQGAYVQINDEELPVVEYEGRVAKHVDGTESLTVYQLGPNPPAGVEQLTHLKIVFDKTALLEGGLIGTATGCVRGNKPGTKGEYRNGALMIQAIDADTGTLDGTLHYATAGLLYESTMFWHWKGACYGEADWADDWAACMSDPCSCIDKKLYPERCGGDDRSKGDKKKDEDKAKAKEAEKVEKAIEKLRKDIDKVTEKIGKVEVKLTEARETGKKQKDIEKLEEELAELLEQKRALEDELNALLPPEPEADVVESPEPPQATAGLSIITHTVVGGSNQEGRLLWREILR